MIKINKGAAPAYLTSTVVLNAAEAVKNLYDGDPILCKTKSFDIGTYYSHNDVKNELIRLQHGKCCFCEARINHISYGDVEHFRPKKGYQQDDTDPLHYPGYYWIAFDWNNLFLSCQLCNQRAKKNFFPLSNPALRATCHHDNIDNESPLFINPSMEEPQDFITFVGEIPSPINGNVRGKETINRLGLDRVDLNENRLEYLEHFRDKEDWFLQCLDKLTTQEEVIKAANQFKHSLIKNIQATSSYSSMIKANYQQYL